MHARECAIDAHRPAFWGDLEDPDDGILKNRAIFFLRSGSLRLGLLATSNVTGKRQKIARGFQKTNADLDVKRLSIFLAMASLEAVKSIGLDLLAVSEETIFVLTPFELD